MFLEADPAAMASFGYRLRSIAAEVSDMADQVAEAEVVGQLSSQSVGLFDEAADVLRVTDGALQRAAMELLGFALPLQPPPGWTLNRRPQKGEPHHPLTGAHVGRPGSAVPAPLGHTDIDHFAAVVHAIVHRCYPAEVGLGPSDFPPGYEAWLDAQTQVTNSNNALILSQLRLGPGAQSYEPSRLREQVRARVQDRGSLPFETLVASAGVDVTGVNVKVSTVAAALVLAASFGGDSALAGRYLADHDVTADLPVFAKVLASDEELALAWFNELGVDRLAALFQHWSMNEPMVLEAALPDLSTALARVSHRSDLGFDGASLVEADWPLVEHVPNAPGVAQGMGFHVELLLAGGGFDAGFVLSAATSSFARAELDGSGLLSLQELAVDRRLSTMLALIRHDAVSAFVELVGPDEVTRLLNPPGALSVAPADAGLPYGIAHPALADTVEVAIPTLFLSVLANERSASFLLVKALADSPNLSATMSDRRIADGYDIMMAGTAVGFVAREHHEVFATVYEQVVAGGSGIAVSLAVRQDTLQKFAAEQIVGNDLKAFETDLGLLAEFVAMVRATYTGAHLDEASRAAETAHLFDLVSAGTSGVGVIALAAGPLGAKVGIAATLAGALLAVAGLKRQSDQRAAALEAMLLEYFAADNEAAQAFAEGVLSAGRVRDSSGEIIDPATVDWNLADSVFEGATIDGLDFVNWVKARALDHVNAFDKQGEQLVDAGAGS